MKTREAKFNGVNDAASTRKWAVAAGVAMVVGGITAQATTDYGPAIWRPACSTHHYNTGVGKQFHVEHDMEGYYASTISYLQGCNNSVSVHYCVNGKQDTSTDMPAGEITQMVLDSQYAWHASCLNTHSMSTEHEGFASNPAWYTEAMYQASAALTASKAVKYGWPKDRNHVIGHNEWQNSAWVNWCIANLGFDPRCNSHTDPGPYWDWAHFMALINGGNSSAWYFGAGNDGWSAVNGTTGIAWQGGSWPGVIYADQTGPDPYWYSPVTSFTGQPAGSINVNVYPQSGTSASHEMKVYWQTAGSITEAKSSPTVTYNLQNGWTRLNIDCNNSSFIGQAIERIRLDFDSNSTGTRWIVNHVIAQETPKYWFGSSASGWSSGNALTGVTWQSDTTWPGIIYADQIANDAFFYSPTLNYLGGANDQIVVRVYPQSGTSANHDMKVYWTTASDGTWSESKSSATVNYTAQNTWAVVTLPVGANPSWSSDYITRLRLDVDGVNSGTRWIIDYVAFSPTTASKL